NRSSWSAPGLPNCGYFLRAHQSYTILKKDWRAGSGALPSSNLGLNGRKNMILITGASGSVGKEVLRAVAKSGAKHRAMYRSAAEAQKAPPGTETVVADFAKPETL